MRKLKVITLALSLVLLVSGMAFAAAEPMVISAPPEYLVKEGEITEVTSEHGVTTVTLGKPEEAGSIVLILNENVPVVDSAKSVLSQDALKAGVHIYALLDPNAPTTLSLPPQTAGVFGVIAAEKSSDAEIQACYEAICEINAKADDAAEKPNAEDSYTALRAAAEAKGYTVTWTSNKAPIKVTKGDITAEITIGSDAFTYTHMTRDIQPLDRMEKLSMPAALQEGKTMVPQSFIDALK